MSGARPGSSGAHRLAAVTAWEPERPAERLTPWLSMARGNSNSYLVEGDDGDVVIDVGTAYQGERNRERFEQLLGRPLAVRAIVLMQGHADHFGGWQAFADAGVRVHASARLTSLWAERTALRDYFIPRTAAIIGRKIGWEDPRRHAAYWDPPVPVVTDPVDGAGAFELGERRFELFAAPGGESLDGIVVWMPVERVAFSGNLLGAMFTQFPHLATIRGDRQRSAVTYIEDVERLLALAPRMLVTSHEEPIAGEERVREELTRLRDAVVHLRDYTIAGMAAGRGMWELMAGAVLPPELELRYSRGPLSWYVRAIWEELTGWYRAESVSELFATPAAAIYPRLAELVGGPAVIAAAAAEAAAAGRPEEALHLTDVALAVAPADPDVLRARREAVAALLARGGGRDYDETAVLESELAAIEDRLGGA